MKSFDFVKNQKGFALVTTYLVGLVALTFSIASYTNALYQAKQLERDMTKVRSHGAAEAGIQKALEQIASGAYTGTINATAIGSTTLQSTSAVDAGTYSVAITYNDADWVIVTATGTSGSTGASTTVLEGSVFLESNLSKYSVYITTNTTGGTNLTLGASDGINSRGVPENAIKRAKYYYEGNYTFGGNGINIYGDFNIQGSIAGHSSYTTQIYGDSYVGAYTENSSGAVTSNGISNSSNVNVSDGFSDDEDRNASGSVTSTDAPDVHDLNATGASDANKIETLPTVNTTWYAANNDVTAFNTAGDRFLILADNGTGANTVVKHVTEAQYRSYATTGTFTGSPTATYSLPNKAVVYNNGTVYVTGAITGRVAVVASNDIHMDASGVSYYGGTRYCSSAHSAAFIATDQIFLRGDSMNLSGILYASNTGAHTTGIEAGYSATSTDYASNTADSSKSYLRFYGNTIMEGTTNTSVYSDRAWIWDSNLSKYRPPGIPVIPELRMVREVVSD